VYSGVNLGGFMKTLILAFVSALAFSANASACDPEAALRDYYGGPEIKNLLLQEVAPGLWSVSYYDEDGMAECKDGLAQVSALCEVAPVRALICGAN
jgi:hypothetical protein